MSDSKNKNYYSRIALAILLIIGISVTLLFSISKPFNDWSFMTDPQLFAQYGNFIGGFVGTIFSLVAVILLYKTLIAQQTAIEKQEQATAKQEIAFEIERFETTFFNLLKTQQDLANDIKAYFNGIDKSFKRQTKTVNGREFFVYAKIELVKIYTALEYSPYNGYFDPKDYESRKYIQWRIEDVSDPNSPNFIFIPEELESATQSITNEAKINYTNYSYKISQDLWNNYKNETDEFKKIATMYRLFFNKHHYAIGHFFRHLYNIVKYTSELEVPLSANNRNLKVKYLNFIQAQMSSFELMLLFYNSTCFPRTLRLLKDYNLLENLAEEDLIHPSHNCIQDLKMRKRNELIDPL